MPAKALDAPWAYLVMFVAETLGLDDDEVGSWPIGKLMRWMAYFEKKNSLEREAFEKAEREAKSKRR
jgi:hypothetical protein